MAGSIDSANLFNRCAPAVSTNIETCGAVTACTAKQVTSADLATIYGSSQSDYRILGNLVAADFLGKAVGVRQNGLYDFLQANKKIMGGKRLSVQQVNGGLWEISPFVKMGRKRQLNTEYWTVNAAQSITSEYDQVSPISVQIFSQGTAPADVRWFPPGLRVFISGRNSHQTGGSGSFDVVSGRSYRVVVSATANAVGSTNAVANYNVGFFSTVPTPGAVALLGLAGLVGRRRR